MSDELDLFREVEHPKRRAYLLALIECAGNITAACDAVGISRGSPYSKPWENDAAYQAALPRARRIAADVLESEMIRRAYQGVEKPAGWYQGKAGGKVTEYSDTLAIFLAKGLLPEKYSEKVEVRGTLAGIDLSRLPDEALARIAAGEHPQSVLASLVSGAVAALPPTEEPEEPEAPTDSEPL